MNYLEAIENLEAEIAQKRMEIRVLESALERLMKQRGEEQARKVNQS